MGSIITNVCVNFNYDRLRIDKALGNWKSDNNKNKHNIHSAWGPFRDQKQWYKMLQIYESVHRYSRAKRCIVGWFIYPQGYFGFCLQVRDEGKRNTKYSRSICHTSRVIGIGDFVQVQILESKFWELGGLNQKSKKNSFVECHMKNWRPTNGSIPLRNKKEAIWSLPWVTDIHTYIQTYKQTDRINDKN